MKRLFLVGIFLFAIVPLSQLSYASDDGKVTLDQHPGNVMGKTVEKNITVYYPVAKDEIDPGYQQNEVALSEIATTLQMMLAPGATYSIDSIVVVGSASPLGGERLNQELSRRRAEMLVKYLKERIYLPDSLLFVRNTGANWHALREMVEASSMKYRNEVLDVIDRVPVNQKRNYVLMDLKWGRPYREMMETFFPQLQNSTTCIIYAHHETELPQLTIKTLTPPQPLVAGEPQIPTTRKMKEEGLPLINLSTNLLYWGLLAPNIGIELCAPQNHWSINAEFVQPWWKKSSKHKYYQIRQFSGEGRYWLKGDGDYRGHFFGVYGNGGIYDLENGGTGYKGNFWGAGLTYGYVLKLKPRFRIEFSLGVGYLSTKYEQYEPIDNCYVYEKTVRKGYVGPTKAKVGLVWTIVQRKKSGRK
ncbi:MAG: DUF3575 domain-containing protein [Bacteroidales bacterium]